MSPTLLPRGVIRREGMLGNARVCAGQSTFLNSTPLAKRPNVDSPPTTPIVAIPDYNGSPEAAQRGTTGIRLAAKRDADTAHRPS